MLFNALRYQSTRSRMLGTRTQRPTPSNEGPWIPVVCQPGSPSHDLQGEQHGSGSAEGASHALEARGRVVAIVARVVRVLGRARIPRVVAVILGGVVAAVVVLVVILVVRARAGAGAGAGVLLALDLVGRGDACGRADLLSSLNGLLLTLLIAAVLQAAGDIVEEVVVGANALNIELAAAVDLATAVGGANAVLLLRDERNFALR